MTARFARPFGARTVATVLLASSGQFLGGCRKEASTASLDGGGSTAIANEVPSATSAAPVSTRSQGSGRAPEGVAKVGDGGSTDGGALDAACDGAVLKLLGAAIDARCAITEREWKLLARPGGNAGDAASVEPAPPRAIAQPGARKASLRQEARRDGDMIVFSIVNGGSGAVILPLRYHAGHPELAFSVLAEARDGGVFELAAAHDRETEAKALAGSYNVTGRPGGERRPGVDAGIAAQHVHIARIRLPPGGRASARLTVDPRIARRLDRRCAERADGGASDASRSAGSEPCLPTRLPAGPVVLHIGQLVSDLDTGEPARVEWSAP